MLPTLEGLWCAVLSAGSLELDLEEETPDEIRTLLESHELTLYVWEVPGATTDLGSDNFVLAFGAKDSEAGGDHYLLGGWYSVDQEFVSAEAYLESPMYKHLLEAGLAARKSWIQTKESLQPTLLAILLAAAIALLLPALLGLHLFTDWCYLGPALVLVLAWTLFAAPKIGRRLSRKQFEKTWLKDRAADEMKQALTAF